MVKLDTRDKNSVKRFVSDIFIPSPLSHKGQNGRALIVGGSTLFHSSPIWAAEIASHIVDIVHLSSIAENKVIFKKFKSRFLNGIVVDRKDIISYIEEDDVVLIGPGMLRGVVKEDFDIDNIEFNRLLKIKDELSFTSGLLRYISLHFPDKRFVLDAGALYMLIPEWLLTFSTPPILTPHRGEFNALFGEIGKKSVEEIGKIVRGTAKKYNSVICLKGNVDIISDGDEMVVVKGGNAGLTKGGTGDTLAGLITGFYAKSNPLSSAVVASFVIKLAADRLYDKFGYWYNIDNLIPEILKVIKELLLG